MVNQKPALKSDENTVKSNTMQAELRDSAGPVSEEEKLFIKYFWVILLDFCEEIYL